MIDPKFLDISFNAVGIRNSQKRLESLITETAVDPLNTYEDELRDAPALVETILQHRIAHVIAYWCKNKHDPVSPRLSDRMGDITNASKHDVTLEEFYTAEVNSALQSVGMMMGIDFPDDFEPKRDFLAQALSTIGHQPEIMADEADEPDEDFAPVANDNHFSLDFDAVLRATDNHPVVQLEPINLEIKDTALEALIAREEVAEAMEERAEQQRAIVTSTPNQVIEVVDKVIQDSVLKLTVEEAWRLIYGLIGYRTDYIQETMLPRWQQNPAAFDKDRRFLYDLFVDTVRNSAGVPYIAGHYTFRDRQMTVDALWAHYFSDLAQNVAPQLAVARLNNSANETRYQKIRRTLQEKLGNVSLAWTVALAIALVLDALTTYISLDQTPMEGPMVLIFTGLITALFQIADQLVISYRQREFDAEAMAAKFHAQYEGLSQEVNTLAITSESYVQLSMNRSKTHADWQAAEDHRKMARRGRYWTARIADINVVVTAYGFSYLFLNSREPMVAVVEQFEAIFVHNDLKLVDPWVFLMVAMAITISFVVNTAQRTEILGWSMSRLKQNI